MVTRRRIRLALCSIGALSGACAASSEEVALGPDSTAGSTSFAGAAGGAAPIGRAGMGGAGAAAPLGGAAGGGSAAVTRAGNGGTGTFGGVTGATGDAAAAGKAGGSVGGGGEAGGGGGTGHLAANCPATAQLCLDFEDDSFGGWTKKESGGTLLIDAAFASHGAHSLAIHAPSGQRGAHLEARGAPLFPLPTGKLWGRMMVYVDGVPDGHTNFASGSGMGGGAYNVSEQHGAFMMSYYAGSPATDCWARPKNGVKVPVKTWACWEWSFDSQNNRLEYWLDGALLVTVDGTGDGCLSGNGTWKAPSEFQALQIGEEIQQPGGDSKVWLDDVAISNVERVGCPAK